MLVLNNTTTLSPPTTIPDAIALFEKSRLSRSVDEILDCLIRLNPVALDKEILTSLVIFIERMSAPCNLSVPHINIFGTGGDKTVNISTITGIIASYSINVIKVGTKAVTSNWGSSEFIAVMDIQNKQRLFTNESPLPGFKNPSRFLPLSDLGFGYGEELKFARKLLRQEGIMDIYKVVFPSTNLTGYMGRVTGYYHQDYYRLMLYLARELQHNALLVHSEHGIDELMPGKNILTHICKGEVVEFEVDVPGDHNTLVKFFSERYLLNEHLKLYEDLLSDRQHFAWTVIAYNIASCLFVRNRGVGNFDSYLEKANALITEICYYQKENLPVRSNTHR